MSYKDSNNWYIMDCACQNRGEAVESKDYEATL